MSLITITADQLANHFNDIELESYDFSDDCLTAVIAEQCDRVAGFIHSSPSSVPKLVLGLSTVPSECVSATLALIRFALLAKSPGSEIVESTVGSARSKEYDAALDFLGKIANGDVLLSYEAEEGLTEESNGCLYGGTNAEDWSRL